MNIGGKQGLIRPVDTEGLDSTLLELIEFYCWVSALELKAPLIFNEKQMEVHCSSEVYRHFVEVGCWMCTWWHDGNMMERQRGWDFAATFAQYTSICFLHTESFLTEAEVIHLFDFHLISDLRCWKQNWLSLTTKRHCYFSQWFFFFWLAYYTFPTSLSLIAFHICVEDEHFKWTQNVLCSVLDIMKFEIRQHP